MAELKNPRDRAVDPTSQSVGMVVVILALLLSLASLASHRYFAAAIIQALQANAVSETQQPTALGNVRRARMAAERDELRAQRYALGEGLLAIALMLSTLYFVIPQRLLVAIGVVLGVSGAVVVATGLLL